MFDPSLSVAPSGGAVNAPIPYALLERRLAEVTTQRDEAQALALDLADKHVADQQEIASLRHQVADLFDQREAWLDQTRQLIAENNDLKVENSDLNSELRESDAQHERERQDFLAQCAQVLGAPPKARVSIARQILEVFDVQRDCIAQVCAERDQERAGREYLEKLILSPALNDTERKVLVHRFGLEGYHLGLPVPTGVWWRYVTDDERATSGIHPRTYRDAEKKFDQLGLFEVQKKDPRPARADDAAHQRKAGHPYDIRRPVPARIEQFLFEELPTIEVRIETERDREEKDRRQQRKVKEEAAAARLKEEAAAGRQLIRERDTFTRERDEARQQAAARQQALEEATRVITAYQQQPKVHCQGCGDLLTVEDLRCAACRGSDTAQSQESVAQVLMNAACINEPRIPVVQAAYNNTTTNDSGRAASEKPQGPCPGCHGMRYHFVDSPRFGPEWRCVTCQPPI